LKSCFHAFEWHVDQIELLVQAVGTLMLADYRCCGA
jgi:hypothetical protein